MGIRDPSDAVSLGVVIEVDDLLLLGTVTMPPDAPGLVVDLLEDDFGTAELRDGVGRGLVAAGYALLRVDLLTPRERRDARHRRDVTALVHRTTAVLDWLGRRPALAGLPLAPVAAGFGAAAVLATAADRPGEMAAVVCWNGRVERVRRRLGEVRAPTLLGVVGDALDLVEPARRARTRLGGPSRLVVVPGDGPADGPDLVDRLVVATGGWLQTWLPGSAVHAARPLA